MKVQITPYLIESAIENCWKVLSILNHWNNKQCRLDVLSMKAFMSDWAEYLTMIDNKKNEFQGGHELPKNIQFVELLGKKPDYSSFDEYLKDYMSAKNVAVLKMSKSIVKDAYQCEENLSFVIHDALNDHAPAEDAFLLESDKYVYAGIFLEY